MVVALGDEYTGATTELFAGLEIDKYVAVLFIFVIRVLKY